MAFVWHALIGAGVAILLGMLIYRLAGLTADWSRYQAIGWALGVCLVLGSVSLIAYLAYTKVYVRAYNGELAYEELIRLEQAGQKAQSGPPGKVIP